MNLRAYRLKTDRKLYSFGDAISQVPICGRPLHDRQLESFRKNKIQLIDVRSEEEINDEQYIIFEDDLAFTSPFVKKLVSKITPTSKSIQFGLAPNRFNQWMILPHSVNEEDNLKFNFFYKRKKSNKTEFQIIEQDLFHTDLVLPPQIVSGGRFYTGRSDCFISRMASPFHLLQINLAYNLMRTVKISKYLPKILLNKFQNQDSRWYFFGLKRLNKIGKNCKIHPSAIIEGSVLEDNVTIGANAVVRLSYVGAGSSISENVVIMNCVLGHNNMISNSNYLSSNLLYDEVFLIHGPYQFSVFGNNAAVFAVINADIRLDQKNIKIPTDVGILDSRQKLLGIAYGHNAKVGGGNIIASGRIVPNNYTINPPDNIYLKFPETTS